MVGFLLLGCRDCLKERLLDVGLWFIACSLKVMVSLTRRCCSFKLLK